LVVVVEDLHRITVAKWISLESSVAMLGQHLCLIRELSITEFSIGWFLAMIIRHHRQSPPKYRFLLVFDSFLSALSSEEYLY